MGRQICFYMSEKTELEFALFAKKNGYKLLRIGYHDHEKESGLIEINNLLQVWCVALYKESYGNVVYRKGGNTGTWNYIDFSNCPVVEFSRTKINNEMKSISYGRIWVTTDDIYPNQEIANAFFKDYKKLVTWIKKNAPKREIVTVGRKVYIDDDMIKYADDGYTCN